MRSDVDEVDAVLLPVLRVRIAVHLLEDGHQRLIGGYLVRIHSIRNPELTQDITEFAAGVTQRRPAIRRVLAQVRVSDENARISLFGCANDPLVFAATQTFGLKISVSPKQDEPVKLVMGYDSNDTTIMPTTMDATRARVAAWTSSCQTKDLSALECVDLPLPMQAIAARAGAPLTPEEQALAVAAQEKLDANPTMRPEDVLTADEQNALEKLQAVGGAHTEGNIGHETAMQGEGKGGRLYQYDSLSVLSSFNAEGEAKAGTEASVGARLGKLFATGVAAQNISDGIQHEMAKEWAPGQAASCLLMLQKVLGEAKVDAATAVAVCGEKPS